jgi:hypothetical protein
MHVPWQGPLTRLAFALWASAGDLSPHAGRGDARACCKQNAGAFK